MRSGPNPKLLGLVAGLAILVGGGAVYFQYNERQSANAEVAKLRAELPDEQKLRADLEKAHVEFKESQTRLSHLEANVPTVAYIPTLLKELEDRGFQSKMKVTGVRPVFEQAGAKKEEAEKKAYQELDIDITGRGSYDAVQQLLDKLKSFPKIVSVQKIDVTPKFKGQSSTYDYLDITVRLKAYMFPEQTTDSKKAKEASEGDVVAVNHRTGEAL